MTAATVPVTSRRSAGDFSLTKGQLPVSLGVSGDAQQAWILKAKDGPSLGPESGESSVPEVDGYKVLPRRAGIENARFIIPAQRLSTLLTSIISYFKAQIPKASVVVLLFTCIFVL